MIETPTFDGRGEMRVAVDEGPLRQGSSFRRYARELAAFSAIAVQFGLIVMVIDQWQFESLSLSRLMDLAFVGFVIHHLLPQRFRLPFFATLSLVATIMILGQLWPRTVMAGLNGSTSLSNLLYHLVPGLTLIGIGLGLIGLCHLPIRFGVHVGLVAAVGAGLVFLRAHIQWFPDVTGIWVVLGSMFMFRLMIYLYDLKNRTAPFSPARAICTSF